MQKFPQVGLRAVFEISGFNRNWNQYQRTMRDIDRITKQTAQNVSRGNQGLASSLDDLIRSSSLLGDAIQRLPLGDQLPIIQQWDQAFQDLGEGAQVNVDVFERLIRSGASFEDALQGAARAAEGLGGSVNILGRSFTTTALAVTATTAALGISIRFVQQSIASYTELAEATRRLSAETGLLAEEASGWVQVAQASGVSANTASRGLAQFLSRVSDLRREQALGQESTGDFAEALEFLDVSITDTEGNLKSTEELLNDVNVAFQRLGPGIQTAGAAQDLFGRTGRQLLPILTDQEQSLTQYLGTLDRFGARLDALNREQYEEFLQAQFELRAAIQGVANTIGSQWIPVLTQSQRIIAAGINLWRTLTQLFGGTEVASRTLAEELERVANILERVDRFMQRVSQRAQALRDILDPVGAATRELARAEEEHAQSLALAAQAAAESARLEQQRQQAIEDTLRGLSELQGQYAAKLADIEQDAAQKWEDILVNRQRDAIDRARQQAFRLIDLQAAYNDRLDAIEADFAKRWEDILVNRQRDALIRGLQLAFRYEDLARAAEQRRQDVLRNFADREAEIRRDAQRRAEEVERDAQRRREELEREHQRRIRDIRQQFIDTATEAARRNDAVAVARAQRQRARELRDEQQRYDDERSDLERALAERRNDIERDRQEREADHRRELERALQRIEENYARQREALERQNQRERLIREIRYRWEMEDFNAAKAEQLQAAEEWHNRQIDALRLAQAREDLERAEQYRRQQEDFERAWERRIADAQAWYERERDALATHLSITGQQLEAIYAEWIQTAAAAAAAVARAASDALAEEIIRYQHLLTEAQRARAQATLPSAGGAGGPLPPLQTRRNEQGVYVPVVPGAPIISQAEGGVVQASGPTNVIMGDAGPEMGVFLPGRSGSLNVNHNFGGRVGMDVTGMPAGINMQQARSLFYGLLTQLAKGIQVPRR